MTITIQTKKEANCDSDVQVSKEDGKHSSALLKEAVVVDDGGEKQKIDGQIPTQYHPEMVDPTRRKPSVDVKDKEDEKRVIEMLETQTVKEDQTGRQSMETNELNQTETLASSSTGPKDDQINHKLKGKSNLKSAIE